MASALQVAGSQEQKPTRYVPIFTNRWFTGLWTQRSPLRDAATPYLYEKFYSGSRFDSLIDGLNTEVTSKLTLARAPGSSVYNSQTFSAINAFYEFHLFPTAGGVGTIKVMADTATNVYDATGPNTKLNIFTKSTGAGQTYFQSVGDTLFFGNGVDQKKWQIPAKQYATSTTYTAGSSKSVSLNGVSAPAGDMVIDINGNLQLALFRQVGAGQVGQGLNTIRVAANVLTVVFNIALTGQDVGPYIGFSIYFTGVANASFLNNGGGLAATTVWQANDSFSQGYVQAVLTNPQANYGPAAETAGNMWVDVGTGTTGNAPPVWATAVGGLTVDGGIIWQNRGSALYNWGITAPTVAPVAVNTINTNSLPQWAANTWYSPSLTLLDTNGNFQQLTTSGTTGAAQPAVWNPVVGGTTADNTAVWTNVGSATRATNHVYAIGNMIQVTFNVTITVKVRDPDTGQFEYIDQTLGPYVDVFKCTVAGTSSSAATSTLNWKSGNGTTVTDGTVVWTNIGKSVTWPTIGANTLVSTNTQIEDSNGNIQNIVIPGKSGGAHPMPWATAVGTLTVDNTATWNCAGPVSLANTGAWIYAFSYKNSTSGHVSTSSPTSLPVTLAASSYITVSGPGSSDPQVDTIEIYRTVQGGSALFFIADITAPANGAAWSYADFSPDPPSPNSTLNNLIPAPIDDENDPPPAGLINLTYHLNRIWGSVGNLVYYSAGPDTIVGSGNESFPPLNTFAFPDVVIRLHPTSIGLMVFTVNGLFVIAGQGTVSSTFYSFPFLDSLGLLSYNALSVNGSVFYMMTTQKLVIELDPSNGQTEVGFPIGDLFAANFNPGQSYLTWHIGGSADKALYVSDGAGTWYRMNPTPAPEVGPPVWSPKRVIATGAKCVQSVETSPGIHQLLIGPATSGPILARDYSVYTDNGTSYNAYATIGACVLAQPGQLAELNFITTDCPNVGARPSISVAIDEVNPAGTFDALPNRVDDPPMLTPSTSLYSDRWYFSQSQLSAWCRSIMVKISWGNDQFANEIYTYTINGAHYTEN